MSGFVYLYLLEICIIHGSCRSHDRPLVLTVVLLLVVYESQLYGEVLFYSSRTTVERFSGDWLDSDCRLAAFRDLLWISKIHLFDV